MTLAVSKRGRTLLFAALFSFLLATRLCHLGIVWVEEGYPSAAALQILYGKSLYREIWFDKPPLSAFVYLLWGAQAGFPLRLAGALYICLACAAMYRFGERMWSRKEGLIAAFALAFYLTFWIPSAVIPLAPDLLMVLPHIGAVYLAWRRRPFWAGLVAGLALLTNSKGAFVLLACVLWAGIEWPLLLAGFAVPNLIAAAWFGRPYWDQVWRWGAVYAAHGFTFQNSVARSLGWTGFHAAAVVCAAVCARRDRPWRWCGWIALSCVAVAAGARFFPRYFFQLLPPVLLLAARGFVLLRDLRWSRLAIATLLVVPLIRFGPRYGALAADLLEGHASAWSDLDLEHDSHQAATAMHGPGSLLVWGYRPDIYVDSRREAGTRFLDSQPLTGVLADRHFTSAQALYPTLAAENRRRLVTYNPEWIVDGLGPLNAKLAITNYPELAPWLSRYRVVAKTRFSIIYHRGGPSDE